MEGMPEFLFYSTKGLFLLQAGADSSLKEED